jgi:hypothetical protein
MSTVIRITIEVQGDARVTVDAPSPEGPTPPDLRAVAQQIFADELVPLPPEPTPVGPFRTIARQQEQVRSAGTVVCPVHNEPWRLVPAGVSKSTGRSYDAFRACPVKGCRERPAA